MEDLLKKILFIYNIDNFTNGKNKTIFHINNIEAVIYKDNSYPGIKRTILECCDMFPCAFQHKGRTYNEFEVIKMANSLDEYLMNESGYNISFCTKYYYGKNILSSFNIINNKDELNQFYEDFLDEVVYEATQKESMSNQLNTNNIIFVYIGKNIKTDLDDKVFIILLKNESAEIIMADYLNDKIKYDSIESFDLQYGIKSPNVKISKIIKDYYNFRRCNAKITPYIELEEVE